MALGGPEPLVSPPSVHQPQAELGAPGLFHRQDRAAATQRLGDPEHFPTSVSFKSRGSLCRAPLSPSYSSGGEAGPSGRPLPALPWSSPVTTLPCGGAAGPGHGFPVAMLDRGCKRVTPQDGGLCREGIC